MERVKLITISIIAYLALGSSVDASEMLLCKVEKDYSKQWIPKIFFLSLPEKPDYSDSGIIPPKVHVMALAKWKKGWFAGTDTFKFEGTVREKAKKQLIPNSKFDSRYQMIIDKKPLNTKCFIQLTPVVTGEVITYRLA